MPLREKYISRTVTLPGRENISHTVTQKRFPCIGTCWYCNDWFC